MAKPSSTQPDPAGLAPAATPPTAPTEAGGLTGCEVHTSLHTLPAEGQQLFHAAGQLDFQCGAPWFANFIATVDTAPAQPQFLLWREQGRVLAVLPLLLDRAAGTARALGNYYTTRFAPLCAEGAAPSQKAAALTGIVRHLLQQEPGVHTVHLGPLEAGSADELALRAALRCAGCAAFALHAFQNWLLPVQQDWPDYLASRDGRLRTTLSRMSRRFAAKGGRLQLLVPRADDDASNSGFKRELDTAIAAYVSVYAVSWKQPEPHPHFMPGLIRAAAASGALRMALAWLDDKPVAAQVWMVAGGRADIYKLAHDEAHKETSPGTLLTSLLMQHVFEVDRVHTVDYLSGDDGYKRLWMSEVRERRHLLAYRLRHPKGLALAARQVGAQAVKAIRQRLAKPAEGGAQP